MKRNLYFLIFPLSLVSCLLPLTTCPVSTAFAAQSSAFEQAVSALGQRRLEDAYKLAKRAVRETPRNPDAHLPVAHPAGSPAAQYFSDSWPPSSVGNGPPPTLVMYGNLTTPNDKSTTFPDNPDPAEVPFNEQSEEVT